jgi:Xaa-Pro aminopeptidase
LGDSGHHAQGYTETAGPPGDAKGELGIRHEDTVAVTESGCENLCPKWSGTPEEPAVG